MSKRIIDAEKLIAEIERRRSEAEKTFNHIFEYASSAKEISEWVSREYNNILSYIDSLQQEQAEIDLEEEVEFYCTNKKVKMTIQELINYYIDTECAEVADECGF